MKAERESRNLSLKEVSESTRIKERLLKAIEEDRYELLFSPVYVKGFLGAYARYLRLDPDEIVLQYQNNQGNNVLLKEPELRERKTPSNLGQWIIYRKKRSSLWLFILSISVIILFIVISMYYPLP